MPETGLYINAVVFTSIQQAKKNQLRGLWWSDYFVIPQAIFNHNSPMLPGRTGFHAVRLELE